jgi:hypothetical protein
MVSVQKGYWGIIMGESKIQFQFGHLSFSGEGSESWLTKQLEFVIEKVGELGSIPDIVLAANDAEESQPKTKTTLQVGSLAAHIKGKGGDSNQNQRFLATADWLRLKGQTGLKANMVSKALQENQQKKLSNPADCLNQNVAKGFCEKTSDGFFITPEGLATLGHQD